MHKCQAAAKAFGRVRRRGVPPQHAPGWRVGRPRVCTSSSSCAGGSSHCPRRSGGSGSGRVAGGAFCGGIAARELDEPGGKLCEHGKLGAGLEALLANETVQAVLHDRHQQTGAVLVAAAAAVSSAALDNVLAAGVQVSVEAIKSAAACKDYWSVRDDRDDTRLQALRVLLSRGVPPVPLDMCPGNGITVEACPVYALLGELRIVQDRVSLAGPPQGCLTPWTTMRMAAGPLPSPHS